MGKQADIGTASQDELVELRRRLDEAEETLPARREGEVDALANTSFVKRPRKRTV